MAGKKQPDATPKKKWPRWAKVYLEALAITGIVTRSAETANISRVTAWRLRERDADFAAAWDDAIERATDLLVEEAKRRAYEGVDEPVTYQGAITATYKKYSDSLLMFLIKARRPEYRDKVDVSHAGSVGARIEIYIPNNGRDGDQAPAGTAGSVPGQPG